MKTGYLFVGSTRSILFLTVCVGLFAAPFCNAQSSNSQHCGPCSSGVVSSTGNPQVALYSINANHQATVWVEFGPDTNYGQTTWSLQAPEDAHSQGMAAFRFFVAGMRANTTYHMRARIQMHAQSFVDDDHTFTTGAAPAGLLPTLTATTTPGMTPQPGVEMMDPTVGSNGLAYVTDLSGNVIWWYQGSTDKEQYVESIKLLPNGHLLLLLSPGDILRHVGDAPGNIDVAREIDLAGNTIREISIQDLNSRLAAAGFNFIAGDFHHDIIALPNGHWIVLVSNTREFKNLPNFPGVTDVLGDVVVDLDVNLNPVWIWNEFDHLDVNRQPFLFPDWTHSNALLYSPDDGDLLVSIRHQNWLVKIDYQDGRGPGDIVWRLGYQGDFALKGGIDPTDWFYAQHEPSFSSSNTTGIYSLGIFDNGNDRVYAGVPCAVPRIITCPFSRAMVLQINEPARTATLTFAQLAPFFSSWGGNLEVLGNGDIEFCESLGGAVYEVMPTVTPAGDSQIVWQLHASSPTYRGFRLPSLYPGVQW